MRVYFRCGERIKSIVLYRVNWIIIDGKFFWGWVKVLGINVEKGGIVNFGIINRNKLVISFFVRVFNFWLWLIVRKVRSRYIILYFKIRSKIIGFFSSFFIISYKFMFEKLLCIIF